VTGAPQLYMSFAFTRLTLVGIAGTGYHLFIFRWLLGRVCSSVFEKNALYTTFSSMCIFLLIGLLKLLFSKVLTQKIGLNRLSVNRHMATLLCKAIYSNHNN